MHSHVDNFIVLVNQYKQWREKILRIDAERENKDKV
jgi:hypothetical protein